jgi:GT2 family glycosyltransferase
MTIEIAASTSPRVSVIIPATASLDLLLATLRSISCNAPRHIPFETIIVLNEPLASDEQHIAAQLSGVHIISATANLGLAGAANRGRARASGELLVLLHDDAEIEPGWLEALVECADTHPEAGAIGGKVLHFDGRLQNAGSILWRDASTSPPWVGEAPSPNAFDQTRAVDYCGTSSLLVRSQLWDAIGGLDDRFYPAYYVDVDLAMSIRELGFVVLYQPVSRIRHHSGASGHLRWRTFIAERNRQLFVSKWTSVLEAHEPIGSDVAAATQRAIARAARHGEMVRGRLQSGPVSLRRPVLPAAAPPDAHYRERERFLREAFVMQLIARIDELETQNAEARATAAAAQELADVRAASVYLPGTRLEFAEGGSAYHYRFAGGHSPESWGVWLGAEPFTIALPIHRRETDPVECLLRLELMPFLADGRSVAPVTVWIDGVVFLRFDETEPGPHVYELRVDVPISSATVHVVITVKGGDARSPTAIGLSDDGRLLSVGIIAMTLASLD